MTAQPIPSTELLDCAVRTARAAGEHAAHNTSRRHDSIKVSAHDVKLELDVECQRIAEDVIRDAYPDHALLGEEDAEHSDETRIDGYEWIVDPIDGTVNFSHGLRRWCCSIAVRLDGVVVAGAVYGPEVDELYTATIDGPARLNGEEIRVSGTDVLERSIVVTGADRDLLPGMPPLALFTRIATVVCRPRVMGCAALDMCQVACGRADGYCEAGVYIWDVAAAGLAVQQAGGISEILFRHTQPHRLQYLSTNGRIHPALKEVVQLSN